MVAMATPAVALTADRKPAGEVPGQSKKIENKNCKFTSPIFGVRQICFVVIPDVDTLDLISAAGLQNLFFGIVFKIAMVGTAVVLLCH